MAFQTVAPPPNFHHSPVQVLAAIFMASSSNPFAGSPGVAPSGPGAEPSGARAPEIEGVDNGEDPGAASETEDDNVAKENVVPENAPENLAGQVDPDAEGSQEITEGDAGADGADATEDAPTEGEGPAADAETHGLHA